MTAEEKLEELYKRGFNAGYMMQKYDPDLLAKFTTSQNPDNVYIKALAAGGRQFEKDLKREELSKSLNQINKKQEQDKSR